jgi:signal transduction histidine kinase
VDELIVRFTDLRTRLAVIETVEKTVTSVCACERAKLVAVSSPRRVRQSEPGIDGRSTKPSGALAVSDPGLSSNVPLLALPESGGDSGRTLFRLTQRAIRRALRSAGVDNLKPEQLDALCNGELVFISADRSLRKTSPGIWAWLLVPVRFREQVIGVLVVSPKLRGKLFSSLDQELLLTIAHQAALALANAIALEELDELRRAEHSAHRERLDRAISTIAAEIAHEIRFPINFFRMLVERQERALHQGKPLSEHDWAEDLDIGREEVSRLERMADRLRKMALSRTVQPRPVLLRSLCEHVRLLLADRLLQHSVKLEIKEGIELLADPDALIQVLLNLLANAIDACPQSGSIGLTSVCDPDGGLRLVVWDDGPGFAAPVARIFEPWFTTKAQGTGLGLAITHRLVRAHGWEIVAERRGARTCFDVVIPVGEWHTCTSAEISLLESVSSDEK